MYIYYVYIYIYIYIYMSNYYMDIVGELIAKSPYEQEVAQDLQSCWPCPAGRHRWNRNPRPQPILLANRCF